MSRFLVTGGCGFIGSHLVDALAGAGHEVRVLDDLSTGTTCYLPADAKLIVGSVADAACVAEAAVGVDGCFHLAAIASVQRSTEQLLATHSVNLGGTLAVLQALRQAGRAVPLVYASSAAVYGDRTEVPIGEDAPKHPQSPYGADKYAGELHVSVAARGGHLLATGLRFFNVYGPRQPPDSPYSGVVSIFADRLGRGAPLTVFGDGGQTRDLVHVSDVVDALVRAMVRRHAGPAVFNVCTGRGVSVLELAHSLGGLLGTVPSITHAPARAGEIRHSVGDPSAGRAALGLGDPVRLEEGLRSVLTQPAPS